MLIRIALSFMLLLSFCTVQGDTFIVTTNADTGTGSFREALTLAAANGTTVKDYIHFNIAGNSLVGLTIVLKSELPLVSSNLVIDASTQPGANLGTSMAKIMLDVDRTVYRASTYEMGGLNIIRANTVEIYGLCFNNFMDFIVRTNPTGQASDPAAIHIAESTDVTIGAPGKGNVFMENDFGIYCGYVYQGALSSKIKVQSNWFGLNTMGTSAGTRRTYHVYMSSNESEFGGDSADKGNVLGGYTPYGISLGGSDWSIRFNRFGYNGDGSFNERMVDVNLTITNGEFSDNLSTRLDLVLSSCKNLKLLRNREELADKIIYNNRVEISYCDGVQIGDDDINNANTFLDASYLMYNAASSNIEVRKNVIHCNSYSYFMRDTKLVTITLLVSNDSEFSGAATPNSEIYIYNDYSDCSTCSPLQFFTQTVADANGDWKITGDFSNKRLVANATLVKNSSEFTQPQILTASSGYKFNKRDPTCGQSNGMLEIANYLHLLKIEWYNRDDIKVGEGAKVEGLPPGRYYVKGSNGKCYTKTEFFDLINVEPEFVDRNLRKIQPSCSRRNGAIRGLYYTLFGGQGTAKWLDDNNTVVSTNLDLENVGPGNYTLVVTTISGCSKSYGPIALSNTDGPNIMVSNMVVTDTDCGTNQGSILGITGTGIGRLEFSWKDQQGTVIAQTADLRNLKPGTYVLSLKDESGCDPVTKSYEVKELNGITIDLDGVSFIKSTCAGNNGSIKGIIARGATRYEWLDANGRLVSSSIDLIGVGAGEYRLRASNATCERITQMLTVELSPNLINFSRLETVVVNASCGQNNGSIELQLINAITPPKAYRWENERGQTLTGNTAKQSNLDAGSYRAYGIDDNNCEIFLVSKVLSRIPVMSFDQRTKVITPDRCSQKIGSIKSLKITGGVEPYSYKWKNAYGEEMSTGNDLLNVFSGNYRLIVTDAIGCEIISDVLHIPNQNNVLATPMVEDVQLCSGGNVVIGVKSPNLGAAYQIYESDHAISPITTSNGTFNISVSQSRSYYVSEKIGSCESSRKEVKVTVGVSAFTLKNTITPNGDQINDVWEIKGIENYPTALVQIFSRSGSKIFESRGYKKPFDGTMNGNAVPSGVYYYMINFGTGCPNLSGSLTVLR